MSLHNVEITEPHPCRRGFFRRIYARVETSNDEGYWVWRQVDHNGHHVTDAERAFSSEDAALSDAIDTLNADAVKL